MLILIKILLISKGRGGGGGEVWVQYYVHAFKSDVKKTVIVIECSLVAETGGGTTIT